MEIQWDKYPAWRLLLPYAFGIVIAVSGNLYEAAMFNIFIPTVFVFLLYVLLSSVRLFALQYRWLLGLTGSLLLFLTGILSVNFFIQKDKPDHFSHLLPPTSDSTAATTYLTVYLAEPPLEKKNTYAVQAVVTQIVSSSSPSTAASLRRCRGNILLYLQKDSLVSQLHYGDALLIKTPSVQAVLPPANPYQFDYRFFLSQQNVFHQAYLRSQDYHLLDTPSQGNVLMAQVFHLQQYLLDLLEKYVPGEQETGVAKALLLGYRYELDSELVQMYAETGTIHLLAVSGLHILLIGNTLYSFFVWLLRRWRKGKQTALVLAIACVVLYTLLSGLSVSAVRAALMYAMVGVGQLLGRRVITLNIVAATAFILLIFNPLSLYNIGFQLSYSAVLGIIWLNPYIQNWWISRHYWADMIWKSVSVTLAASIATLPLLIYYFHQFPLYFVLSNLVAVPVADILLKLGLLLLAVAAIEPLGYALGVLVQQLINVMNGMLGIIQHLPGALWQPLPLSAGEAVVLYACIVGFTMFFINKHVSFLKFALLMLFILSASSFKRAFTLSQHIIVYHIPKHSAIEFEYNRQVYLCIDSTLAHDAAALNFNISPRFKQERLTKIDTLLLEYDYADESILRQSPLLVAGHTSVLLLGSTENIPDTLGYWQPDMVVLHGKITEKVQQILRQLAPDTPVIADGSVAWYEVQRLKKTLPQLYATAERGAYRYEIQPYQQQNGE